MRPKSNRQPETLTAAIARKGANHERISERVARQPGLLPEVLEGLGAEKPAIRYGCSKVLRILSEIRPAILYPRIDVFIGLLDAENHFLKWDAARVVANLAAVDSERKIDRILDHYLEPIAGPVMITAATVIAGAATMAVFRPEWASRIAGAVLKVERAKYQSAECRNVAIGHAVESFGRFFGLLEPKQRAAVVQFVRRQLENHRNAVRKKAAAFLARHGLEFARKAA